MKHVFIVNPCAGKKDQRARIYEMADRLREKKEAEDLYRAFGAAMRTMPPKWRILVLSSHTEFERCFGRPADKKRKLYNGMLKCDVFQYGK